MSTKQWHCEYKSPSNYDRGHWRIYQDGLTKEGFRHLIATTAPDISDEKKHARLIATAPELLAALEAIVALDDGDKPDLWHFEKEFDAARAAIAKATGAQS